VRSRSTTSATLRRLRSSAAGISSRPRSTGSRIEPFGVAEPEHRRHRFAEAADLVVDVDAGGLQRSMIGVHVGGVVEHAHLPTAGHLAAAAQAR
jgi:hypothetical protein